MKSNLPPKRALDLLAANRVCDGPGVPTPWSTFLDFGELAGAPVCLREWSRVAGRMSFAIGSRRLQLDFVPYFAAGAS